MRKKNAAQQLKKTHYGKLLITRLCALQCSTFDNVWCCALLLMIQLLLGNFFLAYHVDKKNVNKMYN